ncbi:MAG: DUF1501 domain-containing protein [Pseudomonadota bacterium]
MNINRRKFLHQIGHVGVALGAGTQLGMVSAAANAQTNADYCAMVCVLLAGGADSFNMLIPYDQARYDQYATTRTDLALPRNEILPLGFAGTDGQEFAVHPGMPQVQALFDSNDLAFVANVGPLAEPTTRTAIDAGTANLPLGLFSHSDQIAVWQTTAAGSRITTGFAGRIADMLEAQINTGPISMNISLSGNALFQTGTQVSGYTMDAEDGARTVGGYDNDSFRSTLDALLDVNHQDPFRQAYRTSLRGAIDSGVELTTALEAATPLNTTFSATPFSQSLRQIARVISARDQIGASRQTFFVTVGGWDHHDEVLNNQANMLPGISQGLSEFHAALVELGMLDNVTTFTISDFGRTLTSNGRGSDHGWGGHQIIMGGRLNGGQIFGQYPDTTIDSELDLGRGRFLPTTSTDEVYADLALWFGISPNDLPTILPNIGRFTDPASGTPPLGLFLT